MAATSIQGKLLEAAVAAIQALNLTGIDDANVVMLHTLEERPKLVALPGILVAPFGGERISPTDGECSSDNIGYPVAIAILAAANQDQVTDLDKRLLWREDLIDYFIHNQLAVSGTGYTLYDQHIEPGPIVDASAWYKSIFASGFTVRCWVEKTRRAS